ncbi:MAG TPA: hypothetical protein VGW98_01195 [Solirubrobacteraceae bacterium]|jgi:hypothetical protein|nr:hypothetical protein [Solirubrobacteraceae bacterium]
MKSHRKITPLIGLVVTLSALVPASAGASSLLSGYGGPGQGTQAILGSALLNGPSGGAGAAPLGGVLTGGAATTAGGGGKRHAAARGGRQPAATATGSVAPGSYPRLGTSQTSAGGAGVLGLSDSAFLLALLALAALLFTGLLTRGLTRASGTRWHAGG